ncbi:MAG: hypothetical protein IPL19_25090 [Sandaracinaceae bacterium]|jgi:hypothetical protein|nr:hypothetical protein [Sandaracinaceae bacterium]
MTDTNTVGALITTYPYDPEQRKVTLWVGLGFLGLSVAFPILYALDADAVGQTVWLSPVLFVGGLLTLAHWVYTGRISLRIHQGGFVHRGRFVPFASIRGLRYKLVQVIGESGGYNRGFCEVRVADGSKVKVHMQLEGMEKVIGDLVGRSMPLICEGILGAVKSGQTVTCGPFQLHPQGMVCKGKSIPWARVAISQSGVDATMQLLDVDPDSGDYKKVHEAKIADVENADAVEAVAEQLRTEAIRARPR